MLPHPWPRPKVEYTPNFNSNEPDITVTIGKTVIPIEVKTWCFNGVVTSYHVKDKMKCKNWRVHQHRVVLFIYSKTFTKAAQTAIKQTGLTLIKGLENLLGTINSIVNGRSFFDNEQVSSCSVCGGVGVGWVYGFRDLECRQAVVLCMVHVDEAVHGRGSVTVALFPRGASWP
jgi:hypothetical protein